VPLTKAAVDAPKRRKNNKHVQNIALLLNFLKPPFHPQKRASKTKNNPYFKPK